MIKHTDIHKNKTISYSNNNQRTVIKAVGVDSTFKKPRNKTTYEYIIIDELPANNGN